MSNSREKGVSEVPQAGGHRPEPGSKTLPEIDDTPGNAGFGHQEGKGPAPGVATPQPEDEGANKTVNANIQRGPRGRPDGGGLGSTDGTK